MKMKIYHLNYYDTKGGAARAAYRIHCAQKSRGMDSKMFVNAASSDDWTVEGAKSRLQKALNLFSKNVGGLLVNALKSDNLNLHSPAVMPSAWPRRMNNSDADVLNMHWVNDEMISIAGIGKLRKPIVWTLHDMWAFCGAEHYTEEFRWREGYRNDNRPDQEGGFDLNRWTWGRKLRHWKQTFHIVTPSRWLAECARDSILMRDWPVTVVPYAIDTQVWKPFDRVVARSLLKLPSDAPLLLFGAMGGTVDPRKGFDLLQAALTNLVGQLDGLELVVFGQRLPEEQLEMGCPVNYTGHLHDDISLSLLYSAADAILVPSRQDNLPLTVLEGLACGTPAIAFRIGGMPDMIEHRVNGYLAQPFDSEDLAQGIKWVLEDEVRHAGLAKAARLRAEESWSNEIVADQYLQVYTRALEESV
jgi:glycosyltransferase involved in cell wall biosynthesis